MSVRKTCIGKKVERADKTATAYRKGMVKHYDTFLSMGPLCCSVSYNLLYISFHSFRFYISDPKHRKDCLHQSLKCTIKKIRHKVSLPAPVEFGETLAKCQ